MFGHGVYGNTRVFSSPGREDLVVKANEAGHRLHGDEVTFIRKAYPDRRQVYLYKFNTSHLPHPHEQHTERLIMPFFKGRVLSSYKKTLDSQKKLFLVILHVTQAFLELHQKSILHGDVAPRNIMVDEQGEDIKVFFVDFGLSACLHRSSRKLKDNHAFNTMIQDLIYQNPVIGYQLVLGFTSIQCFLKEQPRDTEATLHAFYRNLQEDYERLLTEHQQALKTDVQSMPEGTAQGAVPTLAPSFT